MSEPQLAGILAKQWDAESQEERAKAFDTPFRYSMAGKCSRALAYYASGVEETDPPDLAARHVMGLGTVIHEEWQKALQKEHPDALVEVASQLRGLASGHADAVLDLDMGRVCYELKTIGGYAFKRIVGGDGPRYEHVIQGALNAVALEADYLVIGYLATEAISKPKGKGMTDLERVSAEFIFPQRDFAPLARAELGRLAVIKDDLKKYKPHQIPAYVPSPELPHDAVIVNPAKGGWESAEERGEWWGCNYCNWQQRCVAESGLLRLLAPTTETETTE